MYTLIGTLVCLQIGTDLDECGLTPGLVTMAAGAGVVLVIATPLFVYGSKGKPREAPAIVVSPTGFSAGWRF